MSVVGDFQLCNQPLCVASSVEWAQPKIVASLGVARVTEGGWWWCLKFDLLIKFEAHFQLDSHCHDE